MHDDADTDETDHAAEDIEPVRKKVVHFPSHGIERNSNTAS
jgi:hypothetical protein